VDTIILNGDTRRKTQRKVEVEVADKLENNIILYNDDVNTFDHVIQCLIEICNHDPEQAEQCSMLVHFKGRCAVKSGSLEDLVPMCQALCDEGLSAVIE
jgi:ATP-dependent Clp protease adaptor protein ClpS